MKSRVAILGMLVTGVLFSTAGAGLALQSDNAAVSQYGTPTPTPTYVCDADRKRQRGRESGIRR